VGEERTVKKEAGVALMEGLVKVDLMREIVGVARDRQREAIGNERREEGEN